MAPRAAGLVADPHRASPCPAWPPLAGHRRGQQPVPGGQPGQPHRWWARWQRPPAPAWAAPHTGHGARPAPHSSLAARRQASRNPPSGPRLPLTRPACTRGFTPWCSPAGRDRRRPRRVLPQARHQRIHLLQRPRHGHDPGRAVRGSRRGSRKLAVLGQTLAGDARLPLLPPCCRAARQPGPRCPPPPLGPAACAGTWLPWAARPTCTTCTCMATLSSSEGGGETAAAPSLLL